MIIFSQSKKFLDTFLSNTQLKCSLETGEGSKYSSVSLFLHSKVNPSDCIDMVCDAKRKSFLRDMDGSFLGNSGSVIPQAEYEWNGNSQFGIGDYRIPKVMLTFPDGSRIPVTEKAPYKGSLDIILLVLKFVKQSTYVLCLLVGILDQKHIFYLLILHK